MLPLSAFAIEDIIPDHVLTLIQPEIAKGMCISKCSDLQHTDFTPCVHVCMHPEVCSYDWMCNSVSCQQACAPQRQHKPWWFITDVFQTADGLQWDVSESAESAVILLGEDGDGMWSVVAGAGAYSSYHLTADDIDKFDVIAVVLISTTGVQDAKVIFINKDVLTTEAKINSFTATSTDANLPIITKATGSSVKILMFVSALVTTCLAITALILLVYIIRRNRTSSKVANVNISPIIRDYSQIPSIIV